MKRVTQEEIDAAHPLETGRHDLYEHALELVGARHSKGDLVNLVTCLLFRGEQPKVLKCACTAPDLERVQDSETPILTSTILDAFIATEERKAEEAKEGPCGMGVGLEAEIEWQLKLETSEDHMRRARVARELKAKLEGT